MPRLQPRPGFSGGGQNRSQGENPTSQPTRVAMTASDISKPIASLSVRRARSIPTELKIPDGCTVGSSSQSDTRPGAAQRATAQASTRAAALVFATVSRGQAAARYRPPAPCRTRPHASLTVCDAPVRLPDSIQSQVGPLSQIETDSSGRSKGYRHGHGKDITLREDDLLLRQDTHRWSREPESPCWGARAPIWPK